MAEEMFLIKRTENILELKKDIVWDWRNMENPKKNIKANWCLDTQINYRKSKIKVKICKEKTLLRMEITFREEF